jgi:hypothetical protein
MLENKNNDEFIYNWRNELKQSQDIQCVVAKGAIPFGAAQIPSLSDFADGVDTMAFLTNI